MKLIFCPECQDVVKLAMTERRCECGLVAGRYTDNLNAEINEAAIPLGIANSSLVGALRLRPDEGMGMEFTAFVIPRACPTIKVTQ